MPASRPGSGALVATGLPPPTASGGPPSRQLTPTPPPTGRLRTGGSSTHSTRSTPGTSQALGDAMAILAAKLIQKFRMGFGPAAADVQGQEIISQEVLRGLKGIRRGVSVQEEDILQIQNRIRARLVGAPPMLNTMAMNKRAIQEGDEWARIYQFNIAEGKELELAAMREEKERQRLVRSTLDQQQEELAQRKREEAMEEQKYAELEQAALEEWKKQEAAHQAKQNEIAQKLRAERADQLLEKQTRRQRAMATVRMDDDEMAARLAYETKAELDREEAIRQRDKKGLKDYLMSNESNKILKQQAKERAWAEDEYYKKAWEAVLDKQEKERTDRLNRNMARQYKTAEFAQSGKLAEYKKWMDPAVIEKHWREHEAALDRDDAVRKAKLVTQRQEMRERLSTQILERDAAKARARQEDEALGRKVLERAEEEERVEQAKKAARHASKMQLFQEIQSQMKANVANRRYQPIVGVERELNKKLLDKVHDWKLTGSIDTSNTLKLPRHLRTSVQI